MPLSDEESTNRPFTPKDAAEYLEISEKTLLKLLRAGELPAAKIGRQWRISRQALDEFIAGAGNKATNKRKPKAK